MVALMKHSQGYEHRGVLAQHAQHQLRHSPTSSSLQSSITFFILDLYVFVS